MTYVHSSENNNNNNSGQSLGNNKIKTTKITGKRKEKDEEYFLNHIT